MTTHAFHIGLPLPETDNGRAYVYNYNGGQAGACDYPVCTDLVLQRVSAPRVGNYNKTSTVKLVVAKKASAGKGSKASRTPSGPISVTLMVPNGGQYVSGQVLPKPKRGAAADYTTTVGCGGSVTWYGAPVTKSRTFQAKVRVPGKHRITFETVIYHMNATSGLPICRIQRPTKLF